MRSCNNCSECCFQLEIVELKKPQLRWCQHCTTKKSCDIYLERPKECREFSCGYLQSTELFGEEWAPQKCKMVIVADDTIPPNIRIHVHPMMPNKWKEEPYYSTLRNIAQSMNPDLGRLLIRVGNNFTILLPDRDVELGELAYDDQISTIERKTRFGKTYDVEVIRTG